MIKPGRYVEIIPVVRRPYITGRVDRYVSERLKGAITEYVQKVAGLGAGRMPFRVTPRHVHELLAGRRRDPDIVIAIDVDSPWNDHDPAAGKAARDRLRAVGANHTDDARGFHAP